MGAGSCETKQTLNHRLLIVNRVPFTQLRNSWCITIPDNLSVLAAFCVSGFD